MAYVALHRIRSLDTSESETPLDPPHAPSKPEKVEESAAACGGATVIADAQSERPESKARRKIVPCVFPLRQIDSAKLPRLSALQNYPGIVLIRATGFPVPPPFMA